jgi:hypothetical protein
MNRFVPLILLAALGCGRKPSVEDMVRGREVFRPASMKAAEQMVADLKAKDAALYERLQKEAGEHGLAKLSSDEVLKRYAPWLAVTEAEAAAFRAGTVDENLARSRLNAAWAAFAERGLAMPEICRHLGEGARSGALRGIDLEFASRVLAGHVAHPESPGK